MVRTDHGHTRWRLALPGCLLWRSWDQQHLIYHTGSGDTLVLDDPGARMLRLIEQESALSNAGITAEQIVSQLGLPADWPADELLVQLSRQHVIEPAR